MQVSGDVVTLPTNPQNDLQLEQLEGSDFILKSKRLEGTYRFGPDNQKWIWMVETRGSGSESAWARTVTVTEFNKFLDDTDCFLDSICALLNDRGVQTAAEAIRDLRYLGLLEKQDPKEQKPVTPPVNPQNDLSVDSYTSRRITLQSVREKRTFSFEVHPTKNEWGPVVENNPASSKVTPLTQAQTAHLANIIGFILNACDFLNARKIWNTETAIQVLFSPVSEKTMQNSLAPKVPTVPTPAPSTTTAPSKENLMSTTEILAQTSR
jgi:hypothetical protein